jgi:ferredoxin-NADP reductase/MOSC domain-containing protein YiiM
MHIRRSLVKDDIIGAVISINVGAPRDVEWGGKTLRTAIQKTPIRGRVFAGRLNIRGDAQADLNGHGGEHRAIMVYQLESYRFWTNFLKRDDLAPGVFGENLTVDGLADSDVCIGDQIRIGTGIFEVSQPRVTCYKIGLRLDNPQMPSLLVAHKRPGFYLRVIQEGNIGAGDAITKIADGPESMSVAEIDALLYTSHRPIELLQRAIRIPALSAGWHDSFQSLLKDKNSAEASDVKGNIALQAAASWSGFRALTILNSLQESADIRSFEIGAADGSALPTALAGQHLVLRLRLEADTPSILRSYSLCNAPGGMTYRIAVKNEGGMGGTYLHSQVRTGDRLDVTVPRGSFVLVPDSTPLVLLSAGVGITPLLAMLHAAVTTDNVSPREVWWVHSARDKAHHPFSKLSRDLVSHLNSGHHTIVYSRPAKSDRLGQDYDRQGHVSVDVLRDLGILRGSEFYLCGPGQFLSDLYSELLTWGVAAAKIHIESFGSEPGPSAQANDTERPHPPSGPKGTGPSVTFARSRLSVYWDARFKSLLELAEACSVPVRWSCRSGVCHNCKAGLIDGPIKYDPEPLDPPLSDSVLLCCAMPIGPVNLEL